MFNTFCPNMPRRLELQQLELDVILPEVVPSELNEGSDSASTGGVGA